MTWIRARWEVESGKLLPNGRSSEIGSLSILASEECVETRCLASIAITARSPIRSHHLH